jgi:ParB family transcriptional regulator, chromosome partitioning protein
MPNGLGRGLGSLIPQKPTNKQKSSMVSFDDSHGGVLELDTKRIKANTLQPRKKFTDYKLDELVESIKEFGVIQPLIVTKNKDDDNYELIAGERRFRAADVAGLKKVPVIVRNVDDQEKLEVAIIENLQREDLNPIDLAFAYKKLVDDFGLSQEEVAKKMGKSRPSISNTLRMLNLPEEIQLALIDGRITEGHTKYLLGLDSEVKQMSLFRKILNNKMSVSETNTAIKKSGGTKMARNEINYKDKEKEFRLREFFGAKASIKRKGKGGKIFIIFNSDDELNEIIAKVK